MPKLRDIINLHETIDSTTTGIIEEIAREAFKVEAPVEFEWFARQQADIHKTADIAHDFLNASFREPAWALSQLYYDQSLKQSIASKKRGNLAWPAYGLALVGRRMGHVAAWRHYSALALIGDILQEEPKYRGGAIHELMASWGRIKVEEFIAICRERAAAWDREVPVYPEALLAAHWFQSRQKHILAVAEATRGIPFVEVLLDAAQRSNDNTRTGTLFESAVALLLSATPGFEVRGSVEDVSSQTDILLVSRNDGFSGSLLPEGYAIAECKFWKDPVSAATVREFGARCLLVNVNLGIFVARRGITGAEMADDALRDAERERSRLLGRGVHILVLSADDLRERAREMRGLQDLLIEDFERLRFGRRS